MKTPLRIFILDDDMKDRLPIIMSFLKKHKIENYRLFQAPSFQQAEVWFKVEKSFDIGFFDRDLRSDPITGEDVARLCLDEDIQFGQVIVHSGNSVGAERIFRIFKNAGYNVGVIPITSMNGKNLENDYPLEG
jgi:hypothetical protein